MITHVKSGLRTIGLRFDAHAVLFLCKMHDVDINDLESIDRMEYFPSFVWCAYRSYMTDKNRRAHLPYKKMKKIIARLRISEYHKINQAMVEASPPKSEGNGKDDKDKKKQHGKISLSRDGGPGYMKTIS